MLKKVLLLILVLVFAACPLVGCGNDEPTTTTPPAGDTQEPAGDADAEEPVGLGKPVSLNLGHPYTTEDYRGAAFEFFAEKCAELSDGNITITTFPSQTLVTSQDSVKSVATGVADLGCGALSFSVSEVPALLGLDVSGIYDPAYFQETYAAIKPVLDEILATQNQISLFMPDETNTVFYLNAKNAKEVHSPADIKGLRLRDHGTWIGKSITNWSASPMTVMPADLGVALERGTVDGGYTGWGFAATYRCHEIAPYITYTELSKSCWAPLTMNLDKWNSLTAAQQEIIMEAAALASEECDRLLEEDWAKFQAEVEELGGYIYYLTAEENQAFVDANAPLIDEARAATDELGNQLIDALLSAPSNYR